MRAIRPALSGVRGLAVLRGERGPAGQQGGGMSFGAGPTRKPEPLRRYPRFAMPLAERRHRIGIPCVGAAVPGPLRFSGPQNTGAVGGRLPSCTCMFTS